ncbi:MAG TPA: alpha/beta fold hydrolase [Burkholderiales bacterium]|nr:alpha/beta fold hydrolase [Burkholderiales bacterium]
MRNVSCPRRFLEAALLVAAAATITPALAQSDLRFSEDWYPEDCGLLKLRVKEPEPVCGFVSVPLHHGDAASPRIRLAVVVIPAADKPGRQSDPLFLAQGGPGGSTIGGFAQVLLDDPGKRPTLNRDLVLWDQRGTYFSQPRLLCRELGQLPAGADEVKQKDAYRRCGERLAREAGDLSAFNSLANARDVDAVRAALGYEKYNFYGVSYGTELGQFLMRERPSQLRSVVLDAVVPLGFSLVTDVPAVKQQVMQQYARACEESPPCNAAYPSLATRYLALLDRLDKQPVPYTVPGVKAASGAPGAAPQALTGKDLDSVLYQSVYMREAVSLIPYVVSRAEEGDFSFVLNIATLLGAAQDDMADGMYMTVVCSEYGDTPEAALRFPGVLKRLADAAQTDAKQVLALCRDWRIRLLDKALLEPVKSDIPTLLLSGRFDPITPPVQADRVAAGLSRAYRFTFAGGTHGQAFTVPCANRVIAAFLDAPANAPDGACAQEAPPTFVTPDQLLSLPGRKQGGSATIQDHMLALRAPAIALVLALALLFSAVPVYAVTEIVRVFVRRTLVAPDGWQGRLIAAAPWVPVLTGLLLLAFLAVVFTSVGTAVSRNQLLLLVGAVPAWVKELTWGLLPFVLALAMMTLTLALLWRYRARTLMGRLYYTLLVLTGWYVCFALLRTGLFGW